MSNSDKWYSTWKIHYDDDESTFLDQNPEEYRQIGVRTLGVPTFEAGLRWCDICMKYYFVDGSQVYLHIGTNDRITLQQEAVITINHAYNEKWFILLCPTHALELGLSNFMLDRRTSRYTYAVNCPSFIPAKITTPEGETYQWTCELSKNMGVLKINCEACMRTRLREELGLEESSFVERIHSSEIFEKWAEERVLGFKEKRVLAAVKYGEDIAKTEAKLRENQKKKQKVRRRRR